MADRDETEQILAKVDDAVFETDDLGVIMADLSTCANKWKTLSILLGLPQAKINGIETENLAKTGDCWNKALQEWIDQNYNTNKYPPPSWRSLLKAIAREDYALFKQLAAQHPTQANGATYTKKDEVKPNGATGGGTSAVSGSAQRRKMTDRIANIHQVRKIKYTRNGKKENLDLVHKACHKLSTIADLIDEVGNAADNLRREYHGNNEEAFAKLLKIYFIEADPVFGDYPKDWNGLVRILRDAKLGALATEVEEAITS